MFFVSRSLFLNHCGELVLNTDTAVKVSLSCAVRSSVGSGCCTATPCFSLCCLWRCQCCGDTWGSPITTLSTLRLSQPLHGRCRWCFSQCPSQAHPPCLERPSQEHIAAEEARPSCWFERACRPLSCQPGCRRPSQAVSMKRDLCGACIGRAPPCRAYACSISVLSLHPCSGLRQCW